MSYYVPIDLHSEILLRLPAESLARFRCTCKAWRSLIDDHTFLKLHIRLRRQQRDGELHIITVDRDSSTNAKFYSMSLSSFTCYLENQKRRRSTIIKAKCLPISSTSIRLSGSDALRLPMPSCDGFILICRRYEGTPWALYNPFLLDSHQIPPSPETKPMLLAEPSRGFGLCDTCGGFGYDSIHDDYKVVKLSWYRGVQVLTTLIYSLKSNEWHRIEDYPNFVNYGWYDNGVLFNGAIYWIVFMKIEERQWVIRILALDLSTENYRQLPIPPAGNNDNYSVHLDSLGERLFCSHLGTQRMDVWMMQDGGENIIWNKFLSMDHLVSIEHIEIVNITAYEKSKEKVLIIYNYPLDGRYNKAFWYDLVKECTIEIPFEGPSCLIICKPIPSSLIRLTAYQEG